MKLLWEEFIVFIEAPTLPGHQIPMCGLCGNTGWVDTTVTGKTPVGIPCGIRAPCICPNGRALKKTMPKTDPELKKSKNGFNRYWLSWNEYSKDYRPLTDPPSRAIIGWWCSGHAGDESYSTICALVEAKSEESAQKAVDKDWPLPKKQAEREWRFCNPVEINYDPGDRFPIEKGWSKKRFEERR